MAPSDLDMAVTVTAHAVCWEQRGSAGNVLRLIGGVSIPGVEEMAIVAKFSFSLNIFLQRFCGFI